MEPSGFQTRRRAFDSFTACQFSGTTNVVAYKDREKQREYQRKYYLKHKDKHNPGRARRRVEEREKIRELIEVSKNRPCADCGETHPTWAMDFDHMPGVDKKFNLADAVRVAVLKKVEEEIEKCEVVCALCHRYRTHGQKRF